MNIDNIIVKVLMGEATATEIMEFVQWLNASEENQKEFEKIKAFWSIKSVSTSSISVEKSFSRLQHKIKHSQIKKQKKMRALYYVSGIAASFLLVFFIGIWNKMSLPENQMEQYICMTDGSSSTFYLQDSTKVILNKDSKITYSSAYGENERRIKLQGEAYFEVTKNAQIPFIVDMDGATVNVLGTKFTVCNRENSSLIKTVLLEGSVRFTSDEQSVLMIPNQKLSFNKKTKYVEVKDVDVAIEAAWKDGLVKYRSVSFKDLMDRLAKDYGTSVVIDSRRLLSPDLKVSGSFDADSTFNSVLEVIKRTVEFSWKKENGIYYIK